MFCYVLSLNFILCFQFKFSTTVDQESNFEKSPERLLLNDEVFSDHLHKIVDDLIFIYYNLTYSSEYSFLFVNQLCNILNLFNEKRYYQRLTNIVNATADDNKENSELSQLIDNVIRKWLSDNRVSVDAVLNVVFHLLVYLKDEEKVTILNNISEVDLSDVKIKCSSMKLCYYSFLFMFRIT